MLSRGLRLLLPLSLLGFPLAPHPTWATPGSIPQASQHDPAPSVSNDDEALLQDLEFVLLLELLANDALFDPTDDGSAKDGSAEQAQGKPQNSPQDNSQDVTRQVVQQKSHATSRTKPREAPPGAPKEQPKEKPKEQPKEKP